MDKNRDYALKEAIGDPDIQQALHDALVDWLSKTKARYGERAEIKRIRVRIVIVDDEEAEQENAPLGEAVAYLDLEDYRQND